MSNVIRNALLILFSASALHISAADQKEYTVSCTEQNFEGKTYQYSVPVEREKIKDTEYMKQSIKGVRAQCILLPVVHNYQGTYTEIWNRIGDCDVDLYCLNTKNNEKLSIGHPSIQNGLKAGTHQLKATIVRKDGSYQ